MAIRISRETERGCGWRSVGGIYIVGDPGALPCGRLPLETERCPTCGAGIVQARGYTWVAPRELFAEDSPCSQPDCSRCPMSNLPERAGLIWVGEKFYRTPEIFMDEARDMGISRRIGAVPNDFVLGETIVMLAHPKAIPEPCPDCAVHGRGVLTLDKCPACDGTNLVHRPGIFAVWRPTAIQQVVAAGSSEDAPDIQAIIKRGIEPIIVVRS